MMLPDTNYAFLSGDLSTENGKKLIKKLKSDGVINSSEGLVQYNMGKYELVSFDMEKLKEYDPIGVSNYLEESLIDSNEKKEETKFKMRFYDYDDVFDLVKNERKLIVACSDNLQLMMNYDDLADFIVDYNNNVCLRKIECYDYFETMYQPCLITYGDDIDYCIPEMKEDFNKRLEIAKKDKSKEMTYKVIDSETFNQVYTDLGMNKDI